MINPKNLKVIAEIDGAKLDHGLNLFSRQDLRKFNDYIDRILKIIREIREINRSILSPAVKQTGKNQTV